MELPFDWMSRLDELRREQDPKQYEDQRPSLQLPVPSREPPPGWTPPVDDDEEKPSRVIIIDL